MVSATIAIAAAGCSTTSRLEDGEVLYTGVKKITYNEPEGEEVIESVEDQIFSTINVKPNNSLYSPYVRHPFPLGLWVYNHWGQHCRIGIQTLDIRETCGPQPVLISDVKPDLRIEMINSTLENNGYFGSKASYELQYDKDNPKKARINYTINLTTPRTLGQIFYTGGKSSIEQFIDSLARKDNYLQIGQRYCTDSLEAVRIEITNRLRNRGYYYFPPRLYRIHGRQHDDSWTSGYKNRSCQQYSAGCKSKILHSQRGNHCKGLPSAWSSRHYCDTQRLSHKIHATKTAKRTYSVMPYAAQRTHLLGTQHGPHARQLVEARHFQFRLHQHSAC